MLVSKGSLNGYYNRTLASNSDLFHFPLPNACAILFLHPYLHISSSLNYFTQGGIYAARRNATWPLSPFAPPRKWWYGGSLSCRGCTHRATGGYQGDS